MSPDNVQYLTTLIENISDIITILEVTGKIRYESASIKTVLGYEPEELVGKSIFELLHPDDRLGTTALFAASIVKPDVIKQGSVRYKHKDGSWRMLEYSAKNLLFNSAVKGVVITSRDVTEKREEEERMKLSAAALQATANGVAITDRDGNFVWVNHAFTTMTGYTREQVMGKNPRILKSGEQPVEVYRQLWDTVLAGKVWSGEMVNRRKDGSLYFEQQTITPLFDETKHVTHFIAIKQDISERKRMEAEYRQAQKMEAIGQLAAGVAHDFNNLLTVIIGRTELLTSALDKKNPMYEELQEVSKAGFRAADLTKKLLAFSRKQVLQIRIVDLNDIVTEGRGILRRLVRENIEIVYDLGKDLASVKVDPSQIDQVVMNLVVNARDAIMNNGMITITTKNVEVDAQEASRHMGLKPGRYVMLSVKDSGHGMSKEVQAKIFEPFFTTKEKGKGTGLGLSTVYGIMKQSNGYVYVDSQLGEGATFKLYLPPEMGSPEPGTTEAQFQALSGHETILVAEDDEIVRNLTSHVLSKNGYKVIEACDGIQALKYIRETKDKTHLMITDLVMPHMGGTELATKAMAVQKEMKMIFTSGYTTDNTALEKFIQLGYPYIPKPFNPGQLLAIVRKTLDSKSPT